MPNTESSNSVRGLVSNTIIPFSEQIVEAYGIPDWFRATYDTSNSLELNLQPYIVYSNANEAKFRINRSMRERNVEKIHLFNRINIHDEEYSGNKLERFVHFQRASSIKTHIPTSNTSNANERDLTIKIPLHPFYYDKIEGGILYVKDFLQDGAYIRKDTAVYYLDPETKSLYFTKQKENEDFVRLEALSSGRQKT